MMLDEQGCSWPRGESFRDPMQGQIGPLIGSLEMPQDTGADQDQEDRFATDYRSRREAQE